MSQRFLVPPLDGGSGRPGYSSGLESEFKTAPDSSGLIYPASGDRTRPPQPGRAYDFDGTNGYVDTTLSPWAIFGGNAFSCSFWVRADVITGGAGTGSYRAFTIASGAGSTRLSVAFDVGELRLLGNGGASLVGLPVAINTWYHVAVVSNFSNVHSLYVNGVLIGTVTALVIFSDSTVFHIGADGSGARNLNGRLSQARFFSRELTDDEIRSNYLSGIKDGVSRDGLEMEYLCEDKDLSVAFDSSGNKRHGTKIGIDPAVGQFHYQGSDLPHDTSENQQGFSVAASFTDPSGFIRTDSAFDIKDVSAKPFSFAARIWIRPSSSWSAGVGRSLLSIGTGDFQQFSLEVMGTRRLRVAGDTDGVTTWNILQQNGSSTPVPLATWTWAVVTRTTAGVYKLYVDDEEVHTFTNSLDLFINDNQFKVGKHYNSTAGYSWADLMSEARFWTTALSASEVAELVAGGNPATDNLVGSWDFASLEYESSGIVSDRSGNGRTLANDGVTALRIPAVNSATDAAGGSLTYAGEVAKPAKYKQSWGLHGDGLDDHIDFGDPASLDVLTNHVTWHIEAESDVASVTGDDTLFAKYDAGIPAREWLALFNFEEKLLFYIGGANIVKTDSAITLADPHSYTITFSSGTLKIYVDGVEVPWSMVSGAIPSAITPTAAKLGIMNYFNSGSPTGNVWDGRVWNFQIWKGETRALNATEVLELHQRKSIAAPAGQALVFHAPIAEGQGSNVTFDTVSGKPGELIGFDTSTAWVKQDDYHHNATEGFVSAVVFDGVDDYLDTKLLMAGWQEITIWHRSMYLSTSGWDLDGFLEGANKVRLGRGNGTTGLYFNAASATDRTVVGNWLPNFRWSTLSLAIKRDATGYIRVNNTVAQTNTDWVNELSPTKTFWIGASNDSAPPDHESNRLCAEYRIYERQLTADEIRWLNSNGAEGTDPGTEGLRRWYDFTRGHLYDLSPENSGEAINNGGARFVNLPAGVISNNDGLDPFNPYIGHPPALHNGAESQVDFTGGVAFPQPGLPTNIVDWDIITVLNTTRTEIGHMKDELGRSLPYYSMIENESYGYHDLRTASSISFVDGKYLRASIYVKDLGTGSDRWLMLLPAASSAVYESGVHVGFSVINPRTGAITDRNPVYTVWDEAREVGGGWYKLSLNTVIQNSGFTLSSIRLCNVPTVTDTANYQYTGDGESGILVTDWIVEQEDLPGYPGAFVPFGLTNNALPTAFEFPDSLDNPLYTRTITKDGYAYAVDRFASYRLPLLGSDVDKAIRYFKDTAHTFLDNFERPDRSPAGDHWIQTSEQVNLISNQAGTASVTNQAVALYRHPLKTQNPMVEIEVAAWSGEAAGCVVQAAKDGSSYYAFIARDSATDTYGIYRWTGSQLVAIGPKVSTTAPVDPFTMRAEVIGTVMRGYVNGVLVIERDISVVDLSASKYAGIYYE